MGLCPRPQRPKVMKTRRLRVTCPLDKSGVIFEGSISNTNIIQAGVHSITEKGDVVSTPSANCGYTPMIAIRSNIVFWVFGNTSNLEQPLNSCYKETI